MALDVDSILAMELSDVDQEIVLSRVNNPGAIVVQCYADGKVTLSDEAHRKHKTAVLHIRQHGSAPARDISPRYRVIDDKRERVALLKAQVIYDHLLCEVEKNWPTNYKGLDEKNQYDMSKDPNYIKGSCVGKQRLLDCNDPRVIAYKKRMEEFKEWLMAQAVAAKEKSETQFVMDQERAVMSKELIIARAREMARKQVAEATGGKRAANG